MIPIAFGATYVEIWTENTPIRITQSNTREGLKSKKSSLFQSVLSSLLATAQNKHSFSVNPTLDVSYSIQKHTMHTILQKFAYF